jgi:hypothetical protein
VADLGLGRLRLAVRHGVVITRLGGRSLNVLAIGPGVRTPSAGPTVMADWIVGFSRMRKGLTRRQNTLREAPTSSPRQPSLETSRPAPPAPALADRGTA